MSATQSTPHGRNEQIARSGFRRLPIVLLVSSFELSGRRSRVWGRLYLRRLSSSAQSPWCPLCSLRRAPRYARPDLVPMLRATR